MEDMSTSENRYYLPPPRDLTSQAGPSSKTIADPFSASNLTTRTPARAVHSSEPPGTEAMLASDDVDVLESQLMGVLVNTITPSLRPVVTTSEIGDFMEAMCKIDAGWDVRDALQDSKLEITEQELSRYMATFCVKAVGLNDDFITASRREYSRQWLARTQQQCMKSEGCEGEKATTTESANMVTEAEIDTVQLEAHTRQMTAHGERVILTGYVVVIGIAALALGFGLVKQHQDGEIFRYCRGIARFVKLA